MGTATTSFVLNGIDAVPCLIEADVSHTTLPRTMIVGLPDMAVRESTERVRIAIGNSGFEYPFGRVTINLAPADLRKEGPVYDLPIALSILRAGGLLSKEAAGRIDRCLVAGELALDGSLRPVRGIVSMVVLAHRIGVRHVIVPRGNAAEAGLVEGVSVWPADSLRAVVAHLEGVDRLVPVDGDRCRLQCGERSDPDVDLADIKGQQAAKRALLIAAAGHHNLLMIGPPGCGKTMLARSLPGLLPPMSWDEVLELAQIRSCAGRDPGDGPMMVRPVRTPHHTASAAAIVGGGTYPRPGEVSLAHHGVLFLDELPEFSRMTLESLRQPMQDRVVTVSRVNASVRFPASFLLVAAANPSRHGGGASSMDRTYLGRISRPLIDRIDLHVELQPVPVRQLRMSRPESAGGSLEARRLVQQAIDRAHRRQGGVPNGLLSGAELDRVVRLSPEAEAYLVDSVEERGASARAWDALRRIARTIGDLDDVDEIDRTHVIEATGCRLLDQAGR